MRSRIFFKINTKKEWLLFLSVFIFFLILRIISWSNANELDDHDSVSYLKTAESIINQKFDEINPTDTFFYPAAISLFNFLGLKIETAARSASFFFSIILFLSIFLIGQKFISFKSNLIGLIILSLSPFLISFSFAILSEPAYLGIVYFGMFLFWYAIGSSNLTKAFFIGLIFGLTFSCRSEGIIFLLFIPFLKIIYYLYEEKKYYTFSNLIKWSGLFIVGFSLISVPIIIGVSKQMGEFSINGRTAWEKLLKIPDGKTYEQKINGLDLSPSEVNLEFVMKHPDALSKIEGEANIFSKVKIAVYNITDLFKNKLSELIGGIVLIFFGAGIYFLFKEKKPFDLFIVLSFIFIVLLVPCIFLNSFVIRNISIAAPLIVLISGVGVSELSVLIENSIREKKVNFLKNRVAFLLIGIMIVSSLGLLNDSLRHPVQNNEYDINVYSKPISILKNDIIQNRIADPKVITRKFYFTYFTGTEGIDMPYTEYDNLVTYAKLNNANYLFLEYDHLENYPFLKRFEDEDHRDFLQLFSGNDERGKKIELYKFVSN